MNFFAVSRDFFPILEDTSRAKIISSPLLPTASLAEKREREKKMHVHTVTIIKL